MGAANELKSSVDKVVLFWQAPGKSMESKTHTEFAKINERTEAESPILGAANELRSSVDKVVLFWQAPGESMESKTHTEFAKINERTEAKSPQIVSK